MSKRRKRDREAERAHNGATPRGVLQDAYDEATRTASRCSFLGVVGFGLALMMFSIIAQSGSLLDLGHWVEKFLFAGGITGGIVFTGLAIRASRAARECQRRLKESS